MIRDITIGQYFAGDSPLHRCDARMKLALTFAFMIVIFVCGNFFSLGLIALAALALALLSRVPGGMLLRSLRPIVMLVVFTSVLNLLYTTDENTHALLQIPLHFRGWVITVTREGAFTAIFTTVRILCLLLVSSLLTYTTTPSMLTAGLEHLLKPLAKLRVPVAAFAMMMTLALRFVPTLVEETDRIMNAQKSRGSNLETGSLLQRVKAFVPVLVPLFISAFRRAAELANAMESRCYTGTNERTGMKQLRLRARDYIALSAVLLLLGGVVTLNVFFGKIV
ncbi:MAG: energy-coupling factor transporter transmembrane protein EcfT [Oscillospiraceae bacterium]|jgi:energy-coupling factor transport system permease protein|nr:energy-coupling factor transporter transmembrane protein EcfT [Oscillospiraceae bacterium]